MALIYLVIIVATVAGCWKVFVKAGQPGWACLVPFYNLYVMLNMIGKPVWWLVLFFVPIVSLVMSFIVMIELAKRFGKGAGYGVGLALLPFVFFPMLGFSDAQYQR
ncbi:DUF5684 domain-containing protein [Parachitinimonas caeni]|uniref:DUF5684 domain-containing protein n=1 Tax=Parachitinimonas caeni TaxID=3031301 RepID=A0ABT7DR88_9NEIS|nr:DUF5684 domain-containing protein [Parachitinimonas caeni]MDK2122587.1 DUF5684 domain-containing protein [Parachitinimonas caeni]